LIIKPKNKEIEKLLERLTKYPFQTVDSHTAQTLSRYKKIRSINRPEPHVIIRQGTVGLKPNVKLKKTKHGFKVEIF
jgi:hypothetical protein